MEEDKNKNLFKIIVIIRYFFDSSKIDIFKYLKYNN